MNPKSKFKEKLTNMSLSKDKKFIFNKESIYENEEIKTRSITNDIKVIESNSTEINYHLDNLKQKKGLLRILQIIYLCQLPNFRSILLNFSMNLFTSYVLILGHNLEVKKSSVKEI